MSKIYIVVQESNVDGELWINTTPCLSLADAKEVIKEEKNLILTESRHFGNLEKADMEVMEIEEEQDRFYINDPYDDYYEDIYVQEKEVEWDIMGRGTGSFPVMSLCREDLAETGLVTQEEADKLTDEQMEDIAEKLGELYDDVFQSDLAEVFDPEDFGLDGLQD